MVGDTFRHRILMVLYAMVSWISFCLMPSELTDIAMLDHPSQPAQAARDGRKSSRPEERSAQYLQAMIGDMRALLSRSSGQEEDLPCVLAASIAMRYLETRNVTPGELVELVTSLREALAHAPLLRSKPPAVPIEQSVTDDYIICLEDGHLCKSLQRYLKNKFRISPQAYRLKWGLPDDYPMVAQNYSRRRAELARTHQLGRYQRDKSGA